MDKILAFLEDHVEKMVLGIVVIICLWLLVTRVVLSPNSIEYERESYSPGSIDRQIRNQAQELEDILNGRPEPSEPYERKLSEYANLLDDSLPTVGLVAGPAMPQIDSRGGADSRKYNLPDVGQVGDILVGHIRAVAYTPFEEITVEQTYSGSNSEPNDLDLITVQGKYDVASLYASFESSFNGAALKPQWRDPCLADPVFAAVHLQRQERSQGGIWGEWTDVPRTKIDRQRDLFTIIDDARSLPPGGLTVRIMQYRNRMVQQDLLQPAAYQIASANEEWFPPLLYDEYKSILEEQAREERLRQKEEEARKAETDTGRRRRTPSTSSRRSMNDSTRGLADAVYSVGRTSSSLRTGRSRTSRSSTGQRDDYMSEDTMTRNVEKPTVEDVRIKLAALSIVELPDLRTLDELVFWAHDDNVEPGKEYRYRVRLGVFNPVAGKSQLSQRDAARNNDVILWSAFSDVSQQVEIPRRVYFFAKGIQEAAKEVTVQVSKYMLGYWYSEDFKVRGGEIIGDWAETKPDKAGAGTTARTSFTDSQPADDLDEPQEIDYNTGAMLVDVVAVNDFSGETAMRPRSYFDMLYSYDGKRIERMPVGDRYWPEELLVVRSEIRNSQKEPKQPFRAFVGRGQVSTRRSYSPSSRFLD